MRIGLTGGIGSGKSTVARMLGELGATIIDADAIAKAVTGPGGAAIPLLRKVVPELVANEILDRTKAREMFKEPTLKEKIEAIIHPLVTEEAERQAAAASTEHVVFDIPLLVETQHWINRVDRILVVDCSVETQIERVMARNNLTREQVQAVIDRQATREERLAVAHVYVLNDGLTLEELRAEVEWAWSKLVNS